MRGFGVIPYGGTVSHSPSRRSFPMRIPPRRLGGAARRISHRHPRVIAFRPFKSVTPPANSSALQAGRFASGAIFLVRPDASPRIATRGREFQMGKHPDYRYAGGGSAAPSYGGPLVKSHLAKSPAAAISLTW